jgi:RND family efflux transporter MFP subunit
LVVVMVGRIREKKANLAEAKQAAMKQEGEPVRIIVLTVKPNRLADKITLPAEVEPYEELWVKAEASGQVVSVPVEEGEIVQKGEVLVELDDRDYRTRLARIEANHELAKLDYERVATLVRKKITPISQLDTIEAQLKDLAAQLKEAKVALERTKITSPISGRTNEVSAKLGELLAVGTPVAEILQFDQVKITVGVPESDVDAVFDLDGAEVVIDALDGLRVKGKKVFLSRQPRTLARLYDLELLVPNPNGRILPGMFARVELVKRVFDRAITVPLYAVIAHGDRQIVFVEKDGRSEERSVELGVLDGWQVQITDGLQPGDRVVVVGHRFLDDGQPVNVIKNVNHPSEILAP